MYSNKDENISKKLMKNKKRASVLGLLGFLLMSIGVFSTILYNQHLQKQNSNFKDTLTSKLIIVDSFLKKEDNNNFRHDTVIKIIFDFLRIKPDTVNLSRYYSDTLERYYTSKNITLEQLKNERLNYSLIHKQGSVKFGIQDINIDLSNKDTVEAFIKVTYTIDSPQELIYQLKFNPKYKIFFIRNLIPKKDKL